MSHPTTRHLLSLLLSIAAVTGLHAQAAAPDLSDAEVAHVAVTANTIDVELARFAQARTRNADVRKFAATMISDHTAVNGQAAAVAGRLGVTPQDNAVSRSLVTGAAAARAAIEQLEGGALDRAYVDREVAYHQAVLEAIDGLLIPTTSNAELKQLLVDVRPAIAAHLAHAKQLRNSLGSGTRPASNAVPPRRHVVEIRGMAFHPALLVVARGDTIVWVNQDIVPHAATATGSPRWDTGSLIQGQDGRYAPRRSGEAPYICSLHPTMRGTLIIR